MDVGKAGGIPKSVSCRFCGGQLEETSDERERVLEQWY
jgi:hypothetical protein